MGEAIQNKFKTSFTSGNSPDENQYFSTFQIPPNKTHWVLFIFGIGNMGKYWFSKVEGGSNKTRGIKGGF